MIQLSLPLLCNQIVTGAVLGMIFVLLASGLSLILGMMSLINFAHGAFYMVGAYLCFYVVSQVGNFWVALGVAAVMTGVIGVITEVFLLRPLKGGDLSLPLLLTFGLVYVFQDVIRILFGLVGQGVGTPSVFSGALVWGSLILPKYRLFIIVCGAVISLLLWLFMKKTNLGLIIRASTLDIGMVQMLGIEPNRVQTLVFAIGITLAGLAGALVAPIRGVNPEMGGDILIESFIVVIVGGIGSLKGPVIGGLLIGILISLTSLFYGEGSNIIIYFFMALVLLAKPRGLFGVEGLME
jgi:branched-chain amino acid transport system permease protein